MNTYIRPAFVLLLLFTLITGLAYPLAITGFAQIVLPKQANGSLILKDGKVIGSSLVGQSFTSDRYFRGRPSATSAIDPDDATKTVDAPYNAASSTGSNLGPSSKLLKEAIAERSAAVGIVPAPADLVTTSASGLDPHISPAAAMVQIARVAKLRSIPESSLQALVIKLTEGRDFGLLGEPRINVLALNLGLDAMKP